MRGPAVAIACAMAALALGLALAWCVLDSRPQPHDGQLRNAYWPYSVEIQVRDK